MKAVPATAFLLSSPLLTIIFSDMAIALLVVIYLTFISLGLPDPVLGSSFPAISGNLGLSSDLAGYIGIGLTAATILSSFLSSFVLQKVKAKYYVAVSVLMTALGLLLFSFVRNDTWWAFFPIAVLVGLGAGGIDAALNNFVALHYKAIHMNWLHCSWGIGASTSPLILGAFIDPATDDGWPNGVLTISIIQFAIALLVFLTLPLWDRVAAQGKKAPEEEAPIEKGDHRRLLKEPIFYLAVLGFFSYCALETSSGFWGASFFSYAKGLDSSLSASLASLFYIGIAVGRFFSGLLSVKLKPRWMIRIGEIVLLIGSVTALLPLPWQVSAAGFLLIGIGCGPIFPSIILLTPYRFSKRLSQTAMSMEMAVAYLGSLVVSPLFGLIAKSLGNEFGILPYLVLGFAIFMFLLHEVIDFRLRKRDETLSEEEKEAYRTPGV